MQPGVVVEFAPNASLILSGNATLHIRGVEGDSVYLTSALVAPADSNFWGGIHSSGWYYDFTGIDISHAVIADAITAISHSGTDTLRLSDSRIFNCGGYRNYSTYQALYSSGPFNITNFLIRFSGGPGLYLSSPGKVSGTEVSACVDIGIRIGTPGIEIERCRVIDNAAGGIESYAADPNRPFVVHHSHLYGNGNYDIINRGQVDIDAKYNWWGEATTEEMKTGSNPKDISKIYDYFDYNYYGMVKYGGWMNFPYLKGDVDGSGDINVADVVWFIFYLFSGGAAPQPLGVADATCDGKINIADIVCLINYIFGGGSVPGTACD